MIGHTNWVQANTSLPATTECRTQGPQRCNDAYLPHLIIQKDGTFKEEKP
jgi:hypothetical protein